MSRTSQETLSFVDCLVSIQSFERFSTFLVQLLQNEFQAKFLVRARAIVIIIHRLKSRAKPGVFKRLGGGGHLIVMSFSPPVVGCLLKKGFQKRGGHGHLRTPLFLSGL